MNTVTNIVTMAEEAWPAPEHFAKAFGAGLLALFVLYWVVWIAMRGLRHKAGTLAEFTAEKPVGLSTTFAAVEQVLMYLAALAGKEVFGFAVGGWLVFKSVSRYARWQSSDPAAKSSPIPAPARDDRLPQEYYDAAMAHNRFLIFILGTGMSIAAGGIAGVVYHYVLYRLGG